MKWFPWSVILLIALSGGSVRAQEDDVSRDQPPQSGAAELQRVILIEESECDPETAAKLYAAVAGNARFAAEVRTRAWLRLGSCLQSLGRDDEAREALQRASQGAGEAARKAREVLEGKSAKASRLEAQVRGLVSVLCDETPLSGPWNAAREQLEWVGEAAVPFLLESFDWDDYSIETAREVIRLVLEIGGPRAADFVRSIGGSSDLLMKRVAIKAIEETGDSFLAEQQVLGAVERFLDDPDPRVRTQILAAAGGVLSPAAIMALIDDRDPGVVVMALGTMASRVGDAEVFRQLEPKLRGALDSPRARVKKAATAFLGTWDLLAHAAGRRLYLECLQRADLEATPDNSTWPLGAFDSAGRTSVTWPRKFDEAPSSKEVVAAAERVLALDSPPRREALRRFVSACSFCWDHEAIADVLHLVALGLDNGGLWRWAAGHTCRGDLVRVLELHSVFYNPEPLARYVDEHPVPAEALAPLKDWIEEVVEKGGGQALEKSTGPGLRSALLKLRTEEAARYAASLARRFPDSLYMEVYQGLSGWPSDMVETAMLDLATVGNRSRVHANTRKEILVWLGRRGVVEAVPAVAKAYEIGMEACQVGRSYLGWLLQGFRPGGESQGLRYPAEVASRILEGCLTTNVSTVWRDIHHALGNGGVWRLPVIIQDTLRRHVLECREPARLESLLPMLLGSDDQPSPDTVTLFEQVLAKGDEETVLQALQAARFVIPEGTVALVRPLLEHGNPEIVAAAAVVLGHALGGPPVADLVVLLSHKSAQVRRVVMEELVKADPEVASQHLPRLLRDPNAGVRAQACRQLRLLNVPGAAEHLVAALQDPEEVVREAADETLSEMGNEKLRLRRWKKWLREATIEAESPVDALIGQAGKENPIEIRVAAVESLATLGGPELLPVLIEFMRDPEVADAARQAIERINSRDQERPAPQERLPSGKDPGERARGDEPG